MNKKFIRCLDGWRGYAVFLVLIYHLLGQFAGSEIYHLLATYISPLGRKGVQIFFVISGYLIIGNIVNEISHHHFFSIRNFFVKRFFRILPPYYFYLAVCLLVSLFRKDLVHPAEILRGVFFLTYIPIEKTLIYTAHMWSLCLEEYFYLIISILFLFNAKNSKHLTKIILFVLFILLSQGAVTILKIKSGFIYDLLEFRFMFMGGLIAILNKKYADKINWEKLVVARPIFLAFFTLLLFYTPPGYMLIFPVIIGITIHLTTINPTRFISIVFENRPISWLGTISYSVYLWNSFFIPWSEYYIFKSKINLIQQFPLNIGFSLALAVFSYKYIEQPMIRYGRKFLK